MSELLQKRRDVLQRCSGRSVGLFPPRSAPINTCNKRPSLLVEIDATRTLLGAVSVGSVYRCPLRACGFRIHTTSLIVEHLELAHEIVFENGCVILGAEAVCIDTHTDISVPLDALARAMYRFDQREMEKLLWNPPAGNTQRMPWLPPATGAASARKARRNCKTNP